MYKTRLTQVSPFSAPRAQDAGEIYGFTLYYVVQL